ncbi:hypothetical protein QFC21_000969 [Naganishia friedmannii]|uniref:Uncharacterized protein n=1 Tax=Naganishia friedmannii TaxID=89922 RepID=A0ACC2W725_9TREE|nr:hypothetical protein QFC21_000969 [Naganishia friedmannii]
MSASIPTKRLIKPDADAAADAAAQAEFNEKKWVWVPDETRGYLPGWIVNESLSGQDAESTTLTALKAKVLGHHPEGDYTAEENQNGNARASPKKTLEGAALASETLAEVVLADGGEVRILPSYTLSKMNPPKFDRVDDIADLTFLNEASVVHNLRLRYGAGLIYQLPLYTPQIVASYRNKRRDECHPHIFATAERAWVQMIEESACQSVLITGESGAGKTENTKKVIQYLAAIASSDSTATEDDTVSSANDRISVRPSSLLRPLSFRGKEELKRIRKDAEKQGTLEKQILQANPILEAFGNAQTLRNNNSSRFGKFIRILFNADGTILGANVDWYLLEKSRVTSRNAGERNFHVFYQLLASGVKGKEMREKLLLSENPLDYGFLDQSRTQIDGVDDSREWNILKSALRTVGFTLEEQYNIFRAVAAILHIGNITLRADRSDQASITSAAEVERVCHLLGVPVQDFTQAVLRPTVKAGREVVVQARTKAQAEDELAALCKTLYEKTFGVIVDRINVALDRPTSDPRFIGVLDIAGFEIFDLNGYEQLMINFTNERLFFNYHMFVLEQEEYGREKIDWQVVNFGLDLQPTIELIGSGQPMGILATLDDACIMPKATDSTFLQRINEDWAGTGDRPQIHEGATKFQSTRFGNGFIVKHYAGPVEYNTDGWVQKNKDPINDNVANVLSKSDMPAIATLFAEYSETSTNHSMAAGGKRVKRGVFRTASQRHKEQLDSLLKQLQATQPHFVRCIVPNSMKKPRHIDVPLVLDQLRCNGVLEGIRIARLGYPNRLPFTEFRNRYEVLTPGVIPPGYMDGRKASVKIIDALALFPDSYKMGLTKVFFKAGVLAELEERRDAHLYDIFARFQSMARRYTAHRKMQKFLNRANAVRTIQRNARAYNELREWPWWQLFNQVKPLLGASREDEEIQRRQKELVSAKERAEIEQAAKEEVEKERQKLEAEKKRLASNLETMVSALQEREELMEGCKQREVAQQEEIQALREDIDGLEEQLEHAQAENMAMKSKYTELRREYEHQVEKDNDIQQQHHIWQSKTAELAKKLSNAKMKAVQVEKESNAALELRQGLESKLQRLREDVIRIKDKTLAAEKDAQGKVQEEQAKSQQALARVQDLEMQLKTREQRLVTLSSAAEDYEMLFKRKEAEIMELGAELSNAKSDALKAQKSLDERTEALSASQHRAEQAKKEQERLKAGLLRTETELDGLRNLMSARKNEEAHRAEAESSKEKELAVLREQVTTIARQNREDVAKASRAFAQLETQHNLALSELQKLQVQKTKSEEDLRQSLDRLDAQGSLIRTAESVKRGLEMDLDDTRQRLIQHQKELAEAMKSREKLERDLQIAQRKLADHEDALLATERQKADWARKLDVISKDFKNEKERRAQLEQEYRLVETEAQTLQQRLGTLTSEVKAKDEEVALMRSRENKTIVEHVHVLEKAKKVTDRELAATKRERDELATLVRSLDQHKTRLISDIEDMAKQNDLLKKQLKTPSTASVPSTDILQARVKPQAGQEAANTTRSLERQINASFVQASNDPQLNASITDLQDKLRAAGSRIASLESELSTAMTQVRKASIEGMGKSHRTSLPISSSNTRLLQELQLNNAQLKQQMSEELQRSKLGSLPGSTNTRSLDLVEILSGALPDENGTALPSASDKALEKGANELQKELVRLQLIAQETGSARQIAEAQRLTAEGKLRQMQALIEETDLQTATLKMNRNNQELEKERARYQKDLRDFEYTITQTRTKYQSKHYEHELSKLSQDLAAQRADMLRYKEANRLLKAKEEELRMQLEDELHSSSGWKRDRERLEIRVVDLSNALESALSESSKAQGQHVQYIAQMKELRKRLDDSELENAALRAAKQKLEEQSNSNFDKNLRVSNFSQDRAVQQLSREKEELKASLDGMNDRINLARQKQARSEAHATECLQELNKVRQLNADVDRRNISLENKLKTLQVKIIDLETQSFANSPRPAAAKRLETTMADLQNKYDRELEEKMALQNKYRQLERAATEMQAKLREVSLLDRDPSGSGKKGRG